MDKVDVGPRLTVVTELCVPSEIEGPALPNLRWVMRGGERVLQQAVQMRRGWEYWIDWRDVPTATPDSPNASDTIATLKRGERFTVPALPDVPVLTFGHLDDMYSYSTTDDGQVCHLGAWVEVVREGASV